MHRWFTVLIVGSLAAGQAWAASRGQLNRCADATREVRGGPAQLPLDQAVDPRAIESTIRHVNQITERLNRAIGLLNSAGAWSWDDPDLAECTGLMKNSKSYIEAMVAKIESAKKSQAASGPVMAAAAGPVNGDKYAGLYMLAAVQSGATKDVFVNLQPADVKRRLDSLAPVEVACKSAMPETISTPPGLPPGRCPTEYRLADVVMRGDLHELPAWWCYVAGNRQALAQKALTLVQPVAPGYGQHEMVFDSVLKPDWNGAAGPALFEIVGDEATFTAELTKVVQAWYTALGVPVPAEPFPRLKQRIAAVRQAIDAAAARTPVQATSEHDKALEGTARGLLQKNWKKVAVLASWMDAPTWSVKVNALGVPIERSRSGEVVVRVGSESWCRQKPFVFTEPHLGGGKYQAGGKPFWPEVVRAVKCP